MNKKGLSNLMCKISWDAPLGVDKDCWKYQQAHSRIIPLIMNV